MVRHDSLVEQLADSRSRRVVFLSHCLLNENVRYLGGAACAGAVQSEVDRCLAAGSGMCQMPCPEQRAWGGVLKPRMLGLYGSRVLRVAPVRRLVAGIATRYTAWRYHGLARQVAADIADYLRSGFDVVEVVGVSASPSCGVATTLDLDRAIGAMARCDRATLDRATVNHQVVAGALVAGPGLFTAALQHALARRHLTVTFREHDLLAELGEPQPGALRRP